MKHVWWIYALLLAPTLTEIMETGRLPSTLRDLITDAVLTVCIGVLVIFIHRKQHALKRLSETDELTGLKNRRAFQADLSSEVLKSHRINLTLTLAVIDVNLFKSINDQYGHHKGDRVLAGLGRLLKKSVRDQVDTCYRIGGDEFAILFPSADMRGAEGIDRRIELIEHQSTEMLSPYGASLSIGLAALQDGESPENFFLRADSNMYLEKGSSRLRNSLTEQTS